MLQWNLPNLVTIGLMAGVWYALIVAILSLFAMNDDVDVEE